MAETNVKVRLLSRVKTAAEWAANDEVLLAKEVGYVSDKGYAYKVGNGTSKFSELPFAIANTAYALNTPINITIGSTTKSFDGSSDISFSMMEMGALGEHTHSLSEITDIDDFKTSLNGKYIGLSGATSGTVDFITFSGGINLNSSITTISDVTEGDTGRATSIINRSTEYSNFIIQNYDNIVLLKSLDDDTYSNLYTGTVFNYGGINFYSNGINLINDNTNHGISSSGYTLSFSGWSTEIQEEPNKVSFTGYDIIEFYPSHYTGSDNISLNFLRGFKIYDDYNYLQSYSGNFDLMNTSGAAKLSITGYSEVILSDIGGQANLQADNITAVGTSYATTFTGDTYNIIDNSETSVYHIIKGSSNDFYIQNQTGFAGDSSDRGYLQIVGYNGIAITPSADGAMGVVSANLAGNADTATQLRSSVDITIDNTTKAFDGSSSVAWTVEEIGAATSGDAPSVCGYKIVVFDTLAEYTALTNKDPNTIYLIKEADPNDVAASGNDTAVSVDDSAVIDAVTGTTSGS